MGIWRVAGSPLLQTDTLRAISVSKYAALQDTSSVSSLTSKQLPAGHQLVSHVQADCDLGLCYLTHGQATTHPLTSSVTSLTVKHLPPPSHLIPLKAVVPQCCSAHPLQATLA